MSETTLARQQIDLWLREIQRGDEARHELFEAVYGELRAIAHSKRAAHGDGLTMGTTMLVNEVFLRIERDRLLASAPNHRYFFAAVATAAYRTLMDYARNRRATKRGGDHRTLGGEAAENGFLEQSIAAVERHTAWELDEGLDLALTRLARERPRQHEVIMLTYFGGLTAIEAADKLGCSERTIKDDLRKARLWLMTEMEAIDGRQSS